ALVFLAFHLRYLPQAPDDLDSINFALGIRHFDVTAHQPHPPGYPFYILIGKGIRAFVGTELTALAVFSALGGACGVFAIAALALIVVQAIRLGTAGSSRAFDGRRTGIVLAAAAGACLAGALVWAIPLVMLTGGPRAYSAIVLFQGADDIGNAQILWTRHGGR